MVRYLIDCGCEVDIFLAAALGADRQAEELIRKDPACLRARINAEHFPMKNPRAGGTIYQWTLGFNLSPHEVALKFGRSGTFALLKNHSPVEVRLLLSCWVDDAVELRSILEQNPGIIGKLGPAELRQVADAARNNDLSAVRLMVTAGLALHAPGQHNGTALHWAAWHGNAEMLQVLLAGNPPLEDANNEFHCTPLAWAMHGSENGWHREKGDYPRTAELLLAAGARVPNRNDGTAEVRRVLDAAKKLGD